MKVPFLARYCASPWLQAYAALMSGVTYIGAAGAAVVAAALHGTLVEETLIAASAGIAGALISVFSIVWAHQVRKEGWWSANKLTAVALVAALAACAAPRWSAARPSGSLLTGRAIGPALDCSEYDNFFTTPDAVKLHVSSCGRP
jgi:hypothetical protein